MHAILACAWMSLADLARRALWPGARQAGPVKAEARAQAPGQRRA